MEAAKNARHKASTAVTLSSRPIRARRAFRRSAPKRRKSLMRILQILRAHLPEFKAKYPIQSLGVFGSYVRNDATPESDLDVLVELEANARISLMGFVGIENDLTDLLGVKVDLIEKKTLKGRILEYVLKQVVSV